MGPYVSKGFGQMALLHILCRPGDNGFAQWIVCLFSYSVFLTVDTSKINILSRPPPHWCHSDHRSNWMDVSLRDWFHAKSMGQDWFAKAWACISTALSGCKPNELKRSWCENGSESRELIKPPSHQSSIWVWGFKDQAGMHTNYRTVNMLHMFWRGDSVTQGRR